MISALILIAGIYSATNLKTYEQANISLTQEIQSLHQTKEKRKTFIGMCSFNMQILNLFHDIGVFTTFSNI